MTQTIRESRVTRVSCMSLETVMVVTQAIRESRVTRVSSMSLETVMVVTQAIRESRVTRVSSMSLETVMVVTPGYQRVACDQDKFQAGVRRVIVLRLLREGEVGAN